jgi:hypothetical protein
MKENRTRRATTSPTFMIISLNHVLRVGDSSWKKVNGCRNNDCRWSGDQATAELFFLKRGMGDGDSDGKAKIILFLFVRTKRNQKSADA